MAYRELPMLKGAPAADRNGSEPDAVRGPGHEHGGYQDPRAPRNRQAGAAVTRTRDAYRGVPILTRPPWGSWIAGYFFFGGVSSGAFVVGALATLSGGARRATLARTARYVAVAALLPCPPFLIADLGKPERFHHMLRIFKPSSPMNLGAWTLLVHGAGSTLAAAVSLAHEGKIPILGPVLALVPESVVSAAGLPAALTLGGYTGVLLGTSSIPVWYTSPLLGALFMASALSTGVAAVSLSADLMGRAQPGDHRALTSLALTIGSAEVALLAGYLATSGQAAMPLLRGRGGIEMAGATTALILAGALEATSMRRARRRGLLDIIHASATLVGGAVLRWAVVHAGHASAADREGTLQAMAPSRTAPGWGGVQQE